MVSKILSSLSLVVAVGFGANIAKAAGPQFKNDQEKISYLIGFQIGSNFKRDGLEIDNTMMLNGLKEAMAGGTSPIPQEEAQKIMMKLQSDLQAKSEAKKKAEGEKNATAGKAFLAENGKKPGVKTTKSGLQYKIINEGKGDSPKASDTVKTNYRGTLIDGKEFDSSYKRGQPATFPVSGVIKGWTEALQMMKPGSKWQLWVPADLGYGATGAGEMIGPNATLSFEVELLAVNPAAEGAHKTEGDKAAGKPAAAAPAKK